MTGMAVSRGTLEAICLKQKRYHEPGSLNICTEQGFTNLGPHILNCKLKKEINLFVLTATELESLCYNLNTYSNGQLICFDLSLMFSLSVNSVISITNIVITILNTLGEIDTVI